MNNSVALKKSKLIPPFPSINWWQEALINKIIPIQEDTLYNKLNPQNRYYLTGAQGIQLMTIPIKGGRNQRTKIKDVMISYDFDWQSHHWKTIKTLYERSPFYEFFAPEIENLFNEKIEKLLDWNKKSIQLINQLANLNLEMTSNLTQNIPEIEQKYNHVTYHQVFEDKLGFQPNCSILDLLFCEGNNTLQKLTS